MNKHLAVVSCPIDTYSGYGARSRDFVKALIKARPDWNVRILAQRWGSTKFGYLEDHNEKDLAERVIPNLPAKPKVWIQVTVPNEFQAVGDFNIGVTAGIETTVCHESWLQGVNKMDLTLTSAEHGKTVFEQSVYTQTDNKGKEVGTLKVEKPIEVLFEGVDTSKYFATSKDTKNELVKSLDSIPEAFCFLIVGHWLAGDYGEDRKNLGLTIERFLTTFKSKLNKPALIIKTQSANSSIIDQKTIINKINQIKEQIGGSNFPNIYFVHGELQDRDINQLYNHPKVKAMLSLTKGEGFGRPLLEFSAIGKPIIASGWSGHIDFLRPDLNLLVGGKLENVHTSALMENMILKGSKWFNADPNEAAKAYKLLFKNYKGYAKTAKRQASVTNKHFTLGKMQEKLSEHLDKYSPNFPTEMEFVAPAPKVINIPKRPNK